MNNSDLNRGPTATAPCPTARDSFCNLRPLQIPRPKCSGMEFIKTRGRQGFYMSLRHHPQVLAGANTGLQNRARRTPLSAVRFAPTPEDDRPSSPPPIDGETPASSSSDSTASSTTSCASSTAATPTPTNDAGAETEECSVEKL